MTGSLRKKVLQRLWMRISTGLYFIKTDYLARHKTPDAAWIRNIFILLSFYTELFFKMIYILNNNFKNLTDLSSRLKYLGHNLEKTWTASGKATSTHFGIKNVHLKNHKYYIKTDFGGFYVQDFIDIRYDFLSNRVRKLSGKEHDMFNRQIDFMLKVINEQMKPLVWS